MKILSPKYIITCNEDFDILHEHAVVFDKKIVEILPRSAAIEKYGDDVKVDDDIALMPGLINSHVHFEFSGNRGHLKYGSFDAWLLSVIQNREEIVADEEAIEQSIEDSINYGVLGFGAISSYGFDLKALAKSKAKCCYFSEAIGSNPGAVDALYGDFLSRYDSAKDYTSDSFRSAIALHSPYSIHPVFAKKVLEIARAEKAKVSAHFLESLHEREWLEDSKGWFLEFFENVFGIKSSSHFSTGSFLELFDGVEAPLFAHALEAKGAEIEKIDALGGYIASCPRSNRLLNNKVLDITKIKDKKLLFATDGLSSNSTLSLFDEMRAAIFAYPEHEIQELSEKLLLGCSAYAAEALGFDSGMIASGKSADMLTVSIGERVEIDDLVLQIILNTQKPKHCYLEGKKL